jgi:hypothetical protein
MHGEKGEESQVSSGSGKQERLGFGGQGEGSLENHIYIYIYICKRINCITKIIDQYLATVIKMGTF